LLAEHGLQLGRQRPREVVGAGALHQGRVQDQRPGALGMGGGEQRAQGGPLQVAADGWALGPSRVQDRQDILHGVLQDHRPGRVIRESGTALVEHDEPGERRQALVPADQTRPLVVLLQVGGECWNQDQVHRSVTKHPIGDVDTAAVDIPNLSTSHRATTNAAFAGPADCIVSPGWQPVYPATRYPCQWSASTHTLSAIGLELMASDPPDHISRPVTVYQPMWPRRASLPSTGSRLASYHGGNQME
jgi:hypothetical protein